MSGEKVRCVRCEHFTRYFYCYMLQQVMKIRYGVCRLYQEDKGEKPSTTTWEKGK